MRVVVRRRASVLPYTLYDAHVAAMEAVGDQLILRLDRGFHTDGEPGQYCGWVEIPGVQWKHSAISLFELQPESWGPVTGRRFNLLEFVRGQAAASLDIVDEAYGSDRVILTGVWHEGERCLECRMEIYTQECVAYMTEENMMPTQYKYDLR